MAIPSPAFARAEFRATGLYPFRGCFHIPSPMARKGRLFGTNSFFADVVESPQEEHSLYQKEGRWKPLAFVMIKHVVRCFPVMCYNKLLHRLPKMAPLTMS